MAGIYEALNALADRFRTGTKKYLTGTQADMRYLPTLDEALYRLEQYRQGSPVSQAGPGMSVPTATAEDMMAAGLDAVTPMPVGPLQTVFHGTPNKWLPEPGFPKGRPRLDKIGTGEGAQVYGHGVYFAESPYVAKSYHDDLVDDSYFSLKAGDTEAKLPSWMVRQIQRHGDDGLDNALAQWRERLLDEEKKKVTSLQPWNHEGNINRFKKEIAALEEIKKQGKFDVIKPGATYQLDIPDEVIPSLIDWDRPLWDQPKELLPKIKAAFYDLVGDDDRAAELFADAMRRDQRFADHFKGDRGAEALRRHGIPGLSYFDGLSRRAGQGTRNYVIWDQGLLDRITPLDVIQD